MVGVIATVYRTLAKPFSPPDTVRPWAEERWEAATEDRSALPSHPTYPASDYFDAFRVSMDDEGVQVFQSDTESWRHRPNYAHFDDRDPSTPPSTSVATLSFIGVARPVPPKGDEADGQDALRADVPFFDLAGNPVEKSEEWTRQRRFRNAVVPRYHPRLYLRFDHPGQSAFFVDSIRYFDQLTRVDLSRSGVTGAPLSFDGYSVSYADHLSWRRNQTLAVLDISLGPDHTVDLPAKDGAEVSEAGQVLRLLRVFPGLDFSGSSSMREEKGDRSVTYRGVDTLSGTLPPATDPHVCFLVAAYPYGSYSSVDFEAFDREGNPIRTSVTTSFRMPYLVHCDVPAAEVAFLRARIPDRYARLILPLPDLPRLPKENDHLEDLFDMKISMSEADYHNQYESAVHQLTQLKPLFHGERISGHSHALPGLGPPLADTNPRELLEKVRRGYVPGTSFRTDARQATISFGRPGGPDWWDRFKDWTTGWLP